MRRIKRWESAGLAPVPKRMGWLLAMAGLVASALVPGPPAIAAKAKPDLVITSLSNPPARVMQGGSIGITDTVKNAGKVKANASITRYYLSFNQVLSLGDIRLFGGRKIKALGPGATSKAKSSLRVPVSTFPGFYHVIACADDFKKVKEKSEGNNCRASAKPVRVVAYVTSGGTKPELIAFGDSVVVPDDEELVPILDIVKPLVCGQSGSGTVPFAQALKNAEAFLKKEFGQKAVDDLVAAAPTSADAEGLAAASAFAGAPAAALAALIHAHKVEPTNPQHLVNAAPYLTELRMPAEAIAFLNRAGQRHDARIQPMGSNGQAIALNNRAQALIALGKFALAKSAAKAARAIDGNLSEASLNLTVAELCSSGAKKAAHTYRTGTRRDRYKEIVKDDSDVPREQAAASELFDLSQGAEVVLPPLALPTDPEQGATMGESGGFYDQLFDEFQARIQDRQQRQMELEQQADEQSPATRLRLADISYAIATAHVQPELREAYAASVDAWTEVSDHTMGYWNSEVPNTIQAMLVSGATAEEIEAWCRPRTRTMHAGFLDLMGPMEEAGRQWVQDQYVYASGLVAHIGDPIQHDIFSLIVEGDADVGFYVVVDQVRNWAQYEAMYRGLCTEAPTAPPPGSEDDAPDATPSEPCSPELKAASFSASFKTPPIGSIPAIGVDVNANCEQAGVEASISRGPIGAFVSAEHTYRTGETTVFAGGKAGGFGAEAKGGAYVKVGRGGVSEVGLRVGAEYAVAAGNVKLQLYGSGADLALWTAGSPGLRQFLQ